jgi:hypothetical protein
MERGWKVNEEGGRMKIGGKKSGREEMGRRQATSRRRVWDKGMTRA